MATKTDPAIDWQKVASILGVSVPEAHEKVGVAQQEAVQNAEGKSSIGLPTMAPTEADTIATLESQAKSTKAANTPESQAKLREGAEKTFGYTDKEWAALSAEDKAHAIQGYVTDPEVSVNQATKTKVSDEVAGGGLPTPQKAAKGEPATASESPYETLANSLAQQYLSQQSEIDSITEGTPANTGVAQLNAALAGTGVSPTSPLIKAGEATMNETDPTAPALGEAINSVNQEAAGGELQMAQAIANTGKANAETIEAAPWQQLLSELASETAYKAATQGASAFGLTAKNTPAFLAPILQNLGLSATASQGLSAPGTKAASSPTKAATGGSTNTGTEPSTGNNPTT